MKTLASYVLLLLAFAASAAAQCSVSNDPATCGGPAAAQPTQSTGQGKTAAPSVPGQDGITKNQADAILVELKEIRALLLQQNPAPGSATAQAVDFESFPVVKLAGDHRWDNGMGKDDAPVTIVEFSDYQCSHCAKFHQETFAVIKKNYIDTGKVRFVSRDLPLYFHPWAMVAAEASRCAGEQGKYWQMRETLFQRAEQLSPAVIAQIAQALPLDMALFRECTESRKYYLAVKNDIQAAKAVMIPATPGFVIGKTGEDGVEGKRIMGARPYADFQSVIDEALKAKSQP